MHTYVIILASLLIIDSDLKALYINVKQSRYTPWRRLGGEEV
jgi:hypothetical protein